MCTATPPRVASPDCASALVAYYDRRFGVKLDPNKEVGRHARLERRLRQPRAGDRRSGRYNPGAEPVSYPLHSFGFIIAGAAIRSVQAHSPEEYLAESCIAL